MQNTMGKWNEEGGKTSQSKSTLVIGHKKQDKQKTHEMLEINPVINNYKD